MLASHLTCPREVHGRSWSPYVVNGGTAMTVAGADFCVIACDTRMSTGYSIMSRTVGKAVALTDFTVVATAGMAADRDSFHKLLSAQLTEYEHTYIATWNLYEYASYRPVDLNKLILDDFSHIFNVVGGLDIEGKGAVYGYDAIGSFERIPYNVQGSGAALATSILDNQVEFKSHPSNKKVLNADETVTPVKDVFSSIGERDIYTGDEVDIYLITKYGTKHEKFQLKLD